MITSAFISFTARTSDITQLAAICSDGSVFSRYVLPSKPISPEATRATGLSVRGGQLMHNGQAVKTVSTKDCLVDFINYLASKEFPICVGHNIRSFDCPILVHHLLACELFDQFLDSVHGFLHTLMLYKHLLPQKKFFRQEELVKYIVGGQYEANIAIADVAALRGLVDITDVCLESMESFTFSVNAVKHMMMFNAQK